MRVLVPVKPILDPAGFVVNRKAGRIFVNEENFVTNPVDRRALEAALRLKDSHRAEVIVTSVGSPRADDALREALAMGADQAILVTDPACEQLDEVSVTRALAAVIRCLGGVELVCPAQVALDTGGAQVGPRLAEALGWAFLDSALSMELDRNTLRIVRAEDGRFARFEAELPAVVTFAEGAPRQRYPRGPELISAYRDAEAVEQWDLASLDLVPADVEPVMMEHGPSFPPERELGRRLTGSVEQLASALVRELEGS